MTKLRFGVLTSAVVLATSTLCVQTAVGRNAPTENIASKRGELHLVDLSPKIDSTQERNLRLLKLEPGGVAELYSDKGRSTLLQVIKGTLTSHPQGQPEAVLRAGDGFVEGRGSNFWIQNTGSEPAEFIFLHVYDYRMR